MTSMPVPAAPASAVAVTTITDDIINAALREAGLLEPESGSGGFNRVTLDGFMFTFANGDVATSNPKSGAPAFRARLLDVPEEFQSAWIEEPLSSAINRPGFKGFCKSFFTNPDQARKVSESGHDCNACPIGPFVKRENLPAEAEGKKCQWKAEVSFQLVDADGSITDETVHTLTLTTTGIIEFKGTAREKMKGSVSDLNFNQKLARFGAASNPENPTAGLYRALTALALGGIIVDVTVVRTQNESGSVKWSVPVFTPVAIIDIEETPAALLPATPGNDDNLDDLPF